MTIETRTVISAREERYRGPTGLLNVDMTFVLDGDDPATSIVGSISVSEDRNNRGHWEQKVGSVEMAFTDGQAPRAVRRREVIADLLKELPAITKETRVALAKEFAVEQRKIADAALEQSIKQARDRHREQVANIKTATARIRTGKA